MTDWSIGFSQVSVIANISMLFSVIYSHSEMALLQAEWTFKRVAFRDDLFILGILAKLSGLLPIRWEEDAWRWLEITDLMFLSWLIPCSVSEVILIKFLVFAIVLWTGERLYFDRTQGIAHWPFSLLLTLFTYDKILHCSTRGLDLWWPPREPLLAPILIPRSLSLFHSSGLTPPGGKQCCCLSTVNGLILLGRRHASSRSL